MDNTCESCKFNNPKGSCTAIIIQGGKLLLLKRNEEPFAGMLDLPGGYMEAGETPEEALRREVKEELNITLGENDVVRICDIAGEAEWKGKKFAVTNHFFLVDTNNQALILNEENSKYEWVKVSEVNSEKVAFSTNQQFCSGKLTDFDFDLIRVVNLIQQLDKNAQFNEQQLYRAVVNGYVAKIYDSGVLVGMGWIFKRNTMLRNQAVVEDMIIDESQRGKGYGRILLDTLFNWARDNGVKVVELTSSPYRIAANALYQKYGFKFHPTNHYLFDL